MDTEVQSITKEAATVLSRLKICQITEGVVEYVDCTFRAGNIALFTEAQYDADAARIVTALADAYRRVVRVGQGESMTDSICLAVLIGGGYFCKQAADVCTHRGVPFVLATRCVGIDALYAIMCGESCRCAILDIGADVTYEGYAMVVYAYHLMVSIYADSLLSPYTAQDKARAKGLYEMVCKQRDYLLEPATYSADLMRQTLGMLCVVMPTYAPVLHTDIAEADVLFAEGICGLTLARASLQRRHMVIPIDPNEAISAVPPQYREDISRLLPKVKNSHEIAFALFARSFHQQSLDRILPTYDEIVEIGHTGRGFMPDYGFALADTITHDGTLDMLTAITSIRLRMLSCIC